MKRLFAFLIVGLLIGVFAPTTYSYDTGKSPPETVTIDDASYDNVTVMFTEARLTNSNIFERGVKLSPGDIYLISYDAFINYNDYALKYNSYILADNLLNKESNDIVINISYFKGRCTFY